MNIIIKLVILASIFISLDLSHAASEQMCSASASANGIAGTNPDPNVLFCENFESPSVVGNTAPTGWQNILDQYCCYHSNLQSGNGQCGNHTNPVFDWQIKNGTYDPGIVPSTYTGAPPSAQPPFSGNQGFNDCCAAWSDRYWTCSGNHYAQHFFGSGGYTELYFRWYVYLAPEWCVDGGTFDDTANGNTATEPINCGSKNFMISASGSSLPGEFYVATHFNSHGHTGEPFILMYEDTVESHFQNQDTLVVAPNKWYLFEWHIKLNTGGFTRDGLSELWIDEVTPGVSFTTAQQTLRLRDSAIFYGGSNFGRRMGGIYLTPNNNVGFCEPGLINGSANGANCQQNGPGGPWIYVQPNAYLKWDNIVVSKTRIGPMDALVVKAPVNVHAE